MDKVLLIDDEADVQYSFRRIFDQADIELTTANSGEEGLKILPRLKPDLVIMDVRMGGISGLETLRRLRQIDSKQMVIMMTAYGTTQTAIEAMKLGAYDYLLKPFDVPRLKQIVLNALKAARDMRQMVSYQPLLESEDYDQGIIGRSEAMQEVFKIIGQLAASNATALITGESGTGKELVARAIYHHSKRSELTFLAINCAAIPENLLESELFGHEKGAFTGAAAQRIGKFEQCDGGTIFLDEIGDMSLATQAKILRVLQSGSFERVGGNQTIKVDVRVIAATHKNAGTGGGGARVSGGFILPAQRGAHPHSAPAGAAGRYCRCSSTIFCKSSPRRRTGRPNPFCPRRWQCWSGITGRATCASWRMSFSGPRSWPRATSSCPAICRR